MNLAKVQIGDKVKIHNRKDNVAIREGFYNSSVVDSDEKSIAIQGIGKWWFYRDSGESYVGDAIVVAVL